MPTNRLVVKAEVATYASVLLDGLHKSGGQDAVLEVREQLESIAQYMRSSKDFAETLKDVAYTPEQRRDITKKAFAEIGVNPLLLEVLAVMAERGDIDLLPRVYTSFTEQLESKLDLSVVDVTTTVPLDDNLRQLISNKAAQDLGTSVVLREHIDASILGGIIMSVHGKRLDASVTSQLENVRNVLKLSTDGGES